MTYFIGQNPQKTGKKEGPLKRSGSHRKRRWKKLQPPPMRVLNRK
jgi:hypothetical protein